MLQERYDDSQNSIRIMVIDSATMTRTFTVKKSTKVEALITELKSVHPEGNFSLALHGVVMEPGKTMEEYALTENEEVRLMANLEGGSS